MSYKNVQYGRSHVRRNYARVLTNVELPNLIAVQTDSFNWLLNDGIATLFRDFSPIKDREEGERFELTFGKHEFEEPELTIAEARMYKSNYSRKLYCNVTLENKETGEIKEDRVFMGSFPVMTPAGTFITRGSERVLVTQIVRSAGVFFSDEPDKKTGRSVYSGQIIPTRGAWIEFEKGNKDIWYAKLDRSKRIPLNTFIKALGINLPRYMRYLFIGENMDNYETSKVLTDYLNKTNEKDYADGIDGGIRELYESIKPGEKTSVDNMRKAIAQRLFDKRRYDLAEVGRYKFNEKLDVVKRAIGFRLAADLVDKETGEVILAKGTEVSNKAYVDGSIVDTIAILENHRDCFRTTIKEILKKSTNRDLSDEILMLDGSDDTVVEKLDIIVGNQEQGISVRLLGNDQSETSIHIVMSDIFAAISYFFNLHVGVGRIDDIDHLGNRRLRLIGELLLNKAREGMTKVEKSIRDKMSTVNDPKLVTPESLINNRPLVQELNKFFNTDQLSQFMDQINPLAELTHKRRISALGDGGISRDRAGFEVRDVHPSHYGRICPVETPEGQNIGLINSLASYAHPNKYGFIETPYLVVKNNKMDPDYKAGKVPGRVWITDEIKYLTAYDEEKYCIAQANVDMKKDEKTGEILITEDKIIGRKATEFIEMDKMDVDLVDVSPKQVVAVGTSCIPFLEHDDTTRALMGANMQRQAIPLLKPEAPIVGTGIEYRVARDSGLAIVADCDGVVESADGLKIVVVDNNNKKHTYPLIKYQRTNDSTCCNQRPIVKPGEEVKKGITVLADGQSMDQGELALGRNVVIAFMTWNGYNFEDAVIMSEKMVQDDVYTSIHIEQYTCEVRDTKLGKEKITRDLEGESKDGIANLDENGIVILGSEVKEGDTLVGKITPKGEGNQTLIEKLSLDLLSDNAKDVRITSLKVPHHGGGIVNKIEHFDRKSGADLQPGVNEVVRIYIVQKRKISEGDKMSGRHGNKGVISNIVPIEDMPYMPDGTPIDILLNPQGVPSRMNIGQVLEIHLGMAAKKLGVKVATPVFDGVTQEDLVEIMDEAREKDLREMEEDPRNARAPIDQNGKTYLYDGRTGRQFDHKISVGVMYMIKLNHMVDDKLHARSEGPYTLVTQQPLGGKAQNGGQRFGEMEVWALEAYGAAHTLQEMMTIKSDDMIGRNNVYKAIVDGTPIPEAGVPEAFRALVKELQGLGLSVKLVDQNDRDVANESLVDQLAEAQASKKSLLK